MISHNESIKVLWLPWKSVSRSWSLSLAQNLFWVPEPLLSLPFLTFLRGFQLCIGSSHLALANSSQNLSLLRVWGWFWVSMLSYESFYTAHGPRCLHLHYNHSQAQLEWSCVLRLVIRQELSRWWKDWRLFKIPSYQSQVHSTAQHCTAPLAIQHYSSHCALHWIPVSLSSCSCKFVT